MDIPYHRDYDCLLVWHRICCDKCGYPLSEARFVSVEEWWEHEQSMKSFPSDV